MVVTVYPSLKSCGGRKLGKAVKRKSKRRKVLLCNAFSDVQTCKLCCALLCHRLLHFHLRCAVLFSRYRMHCVPKGDVSRQTFQWWTALLQDDNGVIRCPRIRRVCLRTVYTAVHSAVLLALHTIRYARKHVICTVICERALFVHVASANAHHAGHCVVRLPDIKSFRPKVQPTEARRGHNSHVSPICVPQSLCWHIS